MIAWLLSAVAPIPLVLLARTFASLYVIPSESMLPTLQKGDVLLVAKQGIRRGAPPARTAPSARSSNPSAPAGLEKVEEIDVSPKVF